MPAAAETIRKDLDAQILLLEAQISTLASQLRGLKTRRNSISTIWQLPDETLCAIFALYQEEPQYVYNERGWKGLDTTMWISVTAVCKRWRDAALNDPTLWAHIQGSDPAKWIVAKLKRSNPAPLDITIDSRTTTRMRLSEEGKTLLLGVITSQSSRLRSFQIRSCNPEFIGACVRHFRNSSAPQLEVLSLHNAMGNVEDFPLSFLGGTPKLRSLALAEFDNPWNSPLFQNLIELRVLNYYGTAAVPLKDILGALRKMPALRHLEIEMEKPALSGGSSTSSAHSVTLQSLQRLVLRCPETDHAFLESLILPSSVQISFHYRGSLGESTMSSISTSWLVSSAQISPHPLEGPQCESFDLHGISDDKYYQWVFGGTSETTIKARLYTTALRCVGGSIEFSIRRTTVHDIPLLLSQLPLRNIRSLSIGNAPWRIQVDWDLIFPSLRSIIILDSCVAFEIVDYLRHDPYLPKHHPCARNPSNEATMTPPTSLRLPQLQHITLRDVSVFKSEADHDAQFGPRSGVFMAKLAEVLAQRAVLGGKLEELCFDRCSKLSLEDYEELQGTFLCQTRWNGDTNL